MSTPPRYDEKHEPAIRKAQTAQRRLPGYPCPFCGSKSLLLSYGDIVADKYRIELYCDNAMCDAREMTVVALRMEGPVSDIRTDVAALAAVDSGSDEEQAEEGYELLRDESGEVASRMIRASDVMLEGHDAMVLHRRQRPRRIRIEPSKD